jgi:hypothetical protein
MTTAISHHHLSHLRFHEESQPPPYFFQEHSRRDAELEIETNDELNNKSKCEI